MIALCYTAIQDKQQYALFYAKKIFHTSLHLHIYGVNA